MDLVVFIVLALVYCSRTQVAAPEAKAVANLEVRLNPSYYHDETAFQFIYDRLKRGEIE